MSDSRITQAVAEVSAAIELLTNARNTVCELRDEDPAFLPLLQSALRGVDRQLMQADISAAIGLKLLRSVDAAENGAGRVSSLP